MTRAPHRTSPTRRTIAVALAVEAPFVVLVPLAVLQIVPEALRQGSTVFIPAMVGWRIVTYAILLTLFTWLLRPVDRAIAAEPEPSDDVLAGAMSAAYRFPLRISLTWALLWASWWPATFSITRLFDSAASPLTSRFHAVVALVSATVFLAALPLAYALLGWLLEPTAGRLSLAVRARGLDLDHRTPGVKVRLMLFALCSSLAPTVWMSSLAVSAEHPVGELVIFAVVAAAWAPVCAWFLATSVANPLAHVAGLLAEITQSGPLRAQKRIPIYYEDEIGDVARAANRMTDQLASSEAQVAASIEALERQNERVTEALLLREEFLSIAAHELRTPLTSLTLTLDRMRRLKPEASAELGLARARRQVAQLSTLVRDLLDVTHIQSGKLELTLASVSFDEVISECIGVLGETHGDRKLTWEPPPEPLVVDGDRGKLEQVVVNLLDNALKYSRPPASVSVRAWAEGPEARLSVEDRGVGIPTGQLTAIFERFHRVRETSAEFRGLGLGLYICRTLIERHGGRIWALSTPGQGTTFHVALPLRTPQPQ